MDGAALFLSQSVFDGRGGFGFRLDKVDPEVFLRLTRAVPGEGFLFLFGGWLVLNQSFRIDRCKARPGR